MSTVGTPKKISVSFPEADLDRLQAKLDDAQLPVKPIVEDIRQPWEYGTELGKLRQVVADWKSGNPKDSNGKPVGKPGQGVKAWWRSVEEKLNRFPHYQVEIEGITIHYQHFKPSTPSNMPRIPLIFSHGWPGSFTEAYPFAVQLIESQAPAFEVIVPSLPGYGLSSQPPREGWTLKDTARVFDTLMTSVLGFKTYMAQGGDWGCLVTRFLANHEACKIYHTNFLPPNVPIWAKPGLAVELFGFKGFVKRTLKTLGYDAHEILGVERALEYLTTGNAYVKIQNTKPATLGYALYDDPVGILSWLLEKFKEWSDPRAPAFAGPSEVNKVSEISDDSILINTTIYYLTKSIHTSFLPYKESIKFFDNPTSSDFNPGSKKPYGHSHFPYELAAGPKSWIPRSNVNLVHYKRHDYGGHFAATDNPEGLVQDVAEFANAHWPGF